ncbi:MAG: zeta toxin family protein [Dongiaceae bacterium]
MPLNIYPEFKGSFQRSFARRAQQAPGQTGYLEQAPDGSVKSFRARLIERDKADAAAIFDQGIDYQKLTAALGLEAPEVIDFPTGTSRETILSMATLANETVQSGGEAHLRSDWRDLCVQSNFEGCTQAGEGKNEAVLIFGGSCSGKKDLMQQAEDHPETYRSGGFPDFVFIGSTKREDNVPEFHSEEFSDSALPAAATLTRAENSSIETAAWHHALDHHYNVMFASYTGANKGWMETFILEAHKSGAKVTVLMLLCPPAIALHRALQRYTNTDLYVPARHVLSSIKGAAENIPRLVALQREGICQVQVVDSRDKLLAMEPSSSATHEWAKEIVQESQRLLRILDKGGASSMGIDLRFHPGHELGR